MNASTVAPIHPTHFTLLTIAALPLLILMLYMAHVAYYLQIDAILGLLELRGSGTGRHPVGATG